MTPRERLQEQAMKIVGCGMALTQPQWAAAEDMKEYASRVIQECRAAADEIEKILR